MKKKVLIFTDWYLPAFKAGGPVRSIANIVEHLYVEFEFYIVTSDRDLGDENSYEGLELDKWLDQSQCRIQYLSPGNRDIKPLTAILIEVDPHIVYLNSMFSFRFTILPLFTIRNISSIEKAILAPRGMLGKGALGIKPLKKSVFLTVGKFIGLFKGIHWHATSNEENKEIEDVFGKKAKVSIAKNIPQEFKVESRDKKADSLNMLFYSRISKKKNLLEGLKILQKGEFEGNLKLEIVGPIESEEYWDECQNIIEQIEKSEQKIEICYLGSINPNDAAQVFQRNHLFFLPTRHENFGHVIAEALSSSMPVLISNQTPWRNLAESKAGFDVKLNNDSMYLGAINDFLNMDQVEYEKWMKGARAFFEKRIDVASIVNETRNVFLSE